MAKPTHKASEIESFLIETFGHDRRKSIEADHCVPPPIGCGEPATEFRDERSSREFEISGLCQKCQDKIWGA